MAVMTDNDYALRVPIDLFLVRHSAPLEISKGCSYAINIMSANTGDHDMPNVTFSKSGNSVALPSGSSLIDLEDTGKSEVPFGCRSAACGTCTIDVISGMENLSPRNEEEQDLLTDLDLDGDKRRLACQCTVYGDVVIDAING